MKYVATLFFLLSCVFASPYYVGGAIGPGINYYATDNNEVTVRNPAHASFAWNLFVGVQLNPIIAMELAYTNLGFYENSGRGHGICDQQGNCGYSMANNITTFKTLINVVNDINAQLLTADMMVTLFKSRHWRVFNKLGLAYRNVSLRSYANIVPEIIGPLGPEVAQDTSAKVQTPLALHFGLGYDYIVNQRISLRSEVDYYSKTTMVNDQAQQQTGSLYPTVLLFGWVYHW